MNVAFCLFCYDNGQSGISTYCDNVIEELSKQDINLTIYTSAYHYKYFLEKNELNDNLNFHVANIYFGLLGELIYHYFILPLLLKNKYDRVILPVANRRLFALRIKNVFGVFHDLSQIHIKNKYDKFRMFYINNVIKFFLRYITKVHCVSESTLIDVVNSYELSKNKVIVNYNGHKFIEPNEFKPIDIPLKKYNISFVSRLEWPGKNHKALLYAISLLPSAILDNLNLILVGKDWGGQSHIEKLRDELKLTKQVHILGHLENSELEWVYKESDLFVHPSLYEGFGLPLLEAMQRNIPCICSNVGALNEVGGDAVVTFCPYDYKELSDKIGLLLLNPSLGKELSQKGQIRCRDFSWSDHVSKLIYT